MRGARLLVASSLLVVVLMIASPARACACAGGGSPAQIVAGADAAIVGEVISDRLVQDGTMQAVRVDEVYVGNLPPRIEVYAPIGSGTVDPCGVLFSPAHPVAMVLTADASGRLSQDACSLLDVTTLRSVGGVAHPPDPGAEAPAGEPPVNADPGGGPTSAIPWWLVAVMGAGAGLGLITASVLVGRRGAETSEASAEPSDPDLSPTDGP